MNKTTPWAEGLTPVNPDSQLSGFLLRNTSPANLKGAEQDQGPEDEYEGGILTYLVPAAIVGTIAYFIAEAVMKTEIPKSDPQATATATAKRNGK